MTPVVSTPRPAVCVEVSRFAAERGVAPLLDAVVEMTKRVYSAPLTISVGRDAEDSEHRYIALDVDIEGWNADSLVAAQRAWNTGLLRICPPHLAVNFVLGWR